MHEQLPAGFPLQELDFEKHRNLVAGVDNLHGVFDELFCFGIWRVCYDVKAGKGGDAVAKKSCTKP